MKRDDDQIHQHKEQRELCELDYNIPLAIAQKTFDIHLRAQGFSIAVEVLLYQKNPDFLTAFECAQQLAEFTKLPALHRAQQELYRKIVQRIISSNVTSDLYFFALEIINLYDSDMDRRTARDLLKAPKKLR